MGWARYVLERRYGQRTTAVRASSLGRARLADYDVIVFPSGNYGSAVGEGMLDRLRAWMRDGGTVITMAESSRWASRAGLLATEAERRGGRVESDDPPEPDPPEQPIEYLDAISPEDESPEGVPGAILRTRLDTEHWLAPARMARSASSSKARASSVPSPSTKARTSAATPTSRASC